MKRFYDIRLTVRANWFTAMLPEDAMFEHVNAVRARFYGTSTTNLVSRLFYLTSQQYPSLELFPDNLVPLGPPQRYTGDGGQQFLMEAVKPDLPKQIRLLKGVQTFGMIKPDVVASGRMSEMLLAITKAGFTVARSYMTVLTAEEAAWLYQQHKGKDWFPELIHFTISGPVVMMMLEREGDEPAATAFRALMGPTAFGTAPEGTLRHQFATSLRENGIHGSEDDSAATSELYHFFEDRDYFVMPDTEVRKL